MGSDVSCSHIPREGQPLTGNHKPPSGRLYKQREASPLRERIREYFHFNQGHLWNKTTAEFVRGLAQEKRECRIFPLHTHSPVIPN